MGDEHNGKVVEVTPSRTKWADRAADGGFSLAFVGQLICQVGRAGGSMRSCHDVKERKERLLTPSM